MDVIKSINHIRRKNDALIMIMFFIVFILLVFFLAYGKEKYSIYELLQILFLKKEIRGSEFNIYELRLPRMLTALFVGLSFGIGGAVFQSILKNPLASPDFIGISYGSTTGAIILILGFSMSGNIVSFIACLSGLLISGLIYFLSRGSKFKGMKLILVGIGMQAMMRAIISYMLLSANQYDVPAAMRWLSGSLNGMKMENIPILGLVVFLVIGILLILEKKMQVLELGDEMSVSLGLKPDLVRFSMMSISVIALSVSTSISGPISFVSFLSAPIARRIAKGSNNILLISALVGAVIVLFSDIVASNFMGIRMPVGAVTGIICAPYLLYLLYRINIKGRGI